MSEVGGNAASFVTADGGRRVAWSETGDPMGSPVVWCHGGLSSRVDAELAAAGARAAGVRLVTLDRPGLGESDRRKGRSVADGAADVAAVMRGIGVDTFAVVGWSAGGPHALACGAALPDRVTAVATIGGMAPVRDRADRKALGLRLDRLLIPLCRRAPLLAAAALRVSARASTERMKTMIIRPFSAPDRRVLEPLPASVVAGGSLAATAHGVHGVVDDYRAFGASSWGFEPADVQVPVTCWQGADDAAIGVDTAQRLVDLLPDAGLRVVPDAGHFLVLEHGREVFETLLGSGSLPAGS